MRKENGRKLTELEKKLEEIVKTSKFQPKSDTVLINFQPTIHKLSKEEQIYFRHLTLAIFGYSEQVRNENLKQLSTDYHVTLIAPYLCSFIKDTIHCNLVFTDLTLLIYAVRMTKSLLANNHVYLKPYIHEILPAVLSCALAKKISKYYSDNHWTLRDFSAFVVASICEKYSDELNNMKKRVIHLYIRGIIDMNKGLATTYGAIKGISNLGEEEVKNHLLPNIMLISNKIQKILEINYNNYSFYMEYQKQQMNEAKHVRNIMVTICAPILYKTRNINDGGLSYVKDFGYLGKSLYIQVKNIESMEQAKTQQNQYMQQISGFFLRSSSENSENLNVNQLMANVPCMNSVNHLDPHPNISRFNQGTIPWYNIGLR